MRDIRFCTELLPYSAWIGDRFRGVFGNVSFVIAEAFFPVMLVLFTDVMAIGVMMILA